MTESTLWGLSPDWWNLALGAFNTVLLLIGVGFAVASLRQATSQRFVDSFRTMLEEYHDEVLGERAPQIDRAFPIVDGDLAHRLEAFIEHALDDLTSADLVAAEEVVYKLNAIGSLMERGAVLETHFFEYAHPRIITLTSRLEPYILVRSALLDQRWGMRVRRIKHGAVLCYRMSPLYNSRDCRADGVTLVKAVRLPWRERLEIHLRKLVGRSPYLRAARAFREVDRHDLAVAASTVARFADKDLGFLTAPGRSS